MLDWRLYFCREFALYAERRDTTKGQTEGQDTTTRKENRHDNAIPLRIGKLLCCVQAAPMRTYGQTDEGPGVPEQAVRASGEARGSSVLETERADSIGKSKKEGSDSKDD